MSTDLDRPDAPALRHARGAVAALFLTNGALFANLIPRYPQIKEALELPSAAYGAAIAGWPMGAMVAGLGAGALVRRFGSARVAVVGTLLTSLGIFAAGAAPTVWVFVLALLLGGGMDAITDVAQNTHGLRVQRLYRRSIINSFHAVWSIGAVLGGAMAAGAIALEVPLPLHLGTTAVVFSVVSLVALRFTLPGRERSDAAESPSAPAASRHTGRAGTRVLLALLALVLIGIAGAVGEDAGNSWATLYLGSDLGAAGALAASGYIALVGAQFIGRVLSDRMVDRFGQRAVARTGGLIVAIGMGLALAWPTVPGTIAGFAATGFGVAPLIPLAMNQADELPGLRPGTGLTIVSWLLRLGFLLSPPLIGWVTDVTSLRVGLLLVPLAGLTALVLARVLPGRRFYRLP